MNKELQMFCSQSKCQNQDINCEDCEYLVREQTHKMTTSEAIEMLKRAEIAKPIKFEDYADMKEALDMAIKALEQNPKAHGTWKHMGHDEYQCSCCGFTFVGDDTEDENYCQFCGADMRAES